MSQMIFSISLRRAQTLSNAINRLQINQGSRNFCTGYCLDKHATANRTKSIPLLPIDLLKVPHRTLYSKENLGLDRVKIVRDSKFELYKNHKDRYIERLSGYLESGNVQLILKDDVTNLIGLAENEQHVDLIERVIENLKADKSLYASGLGTAVMRLYCSMDLVDRAYNSLKNYEKFGEFFNQYTTYKIVLTMLFNAGKFAQVIEIYQLARERFRPDSRQDGFSRSFPGLAIVAFGALARQNNPTALELAEKLFNEVELREYSTYLRTRLITFLSYLAIKQDKPALALNLISGAQGRNYVTMREHKTIALMKLKRYEDVVYHLRDSLSRQSELPVERQSSIILRETLESIEGSLGEIDEASSREALMGIIDELKKSVLVNDVTLESIVFAPLGSRSSNFGLPGDQVKQDSMNRQRPPYSRPDNRFNNTRSDDYESRPRYQPGGRRGNSFDRQQRYQSKSYFEEDLDSEFGNDDAIETQRRFK